MRNTPLVAKPIAMSLMAKRSGRSPRRPIPSKGRKVNLFKFSVDKAAIDRQITNELVGMIMPGENKMVENYVPPKPIDSSGIGSTVIWTAKEGFKVGAEAPKQPKISFDEMIEAGQREKERLVQVANAGNVMNDGIEEGDSRIFKESEGTKTFVDKPLGARIKLRKPDTPHQTLAGAMADAAAQIREVARNYYSNYDELPANDVTLPEAGVEIFKIGPKQYIFEEAIVGSITITKTPVITKELGHTHFPSPEPRDLIARLHFHWTDTRPSLKDKTTFDIVSNNVGPDYEAWIATYEIEERVFPRAK